MSEHRGGCHCGNLRLTLRLSQPPADTQLRACACSFCRAHNTRTTSDPNGSVDIHAANWSVVERYRFGTRTAEFLICKRCGVYIGAIGETASGTCAIINTNCLDDRAAFTQQPDPVDHDGEVAGDRLGRQLDAGDDSPGVTQRPGWQPGWHPSQPSSCQVVGNPRHIPPGRVLVARFRPLERAEHLLQSLAL